MPTLKKRIPKKPTKQAMVRARAKDALKAADKSFPHYLDKKSMVRSATRKLKIGKDAAYEKRQRVKEITESKRLREKAKKPKKVLTKAQILKNARRDTISKAIIKKPSTIGKIVKGVSKVGSRVLGVGGLAATMAIPAYMDKMKKGTKAMSKRMEDIAAKNKAKRLAARNAKKAKV